jgi:hypothetical protein
LFVVAHAGFLYMSIPEPIFMASRSHCHLLFDCYFIATHFHSDDGSSSFLRNIGEFIPDFTMSDPQDKFLKRFHCLFSLIMQKLVSFLKKLYVLWGFTRFEACGSGLLYTFTRISNFRVLFDLAWIDIASRFVWYCILSEQCCVAAAIVRHLTLLMDHRRF